MKGNRFYSRWLFPFKYQGEGIWRECPFLSSLFHWGSTWDTSASGVCQLGPLQIFIQSSLSFSPSLSLWRDGDITFCYLKWAQREGLFLRKNYKISRLLFSSAAIPFISTGNWNRGRHLWDVINRNLGWGYIQIGFKSVESNCVIFETFLTGIVLATCPVWAIGSSHTDVQD